MEDGVVNNETIIFAGNEECQIKNKSIQLFILVKRINNLDIYEKFVGVIKLI